MFSGSDGMSELRKLLMEELKQGNDELVDPLPYGCAGKKIKSLDHNVR